MAENEKVDSPALRFAIMKGRVKGGPLAEGSKNLSPVQELREWKDAVGVVRVLVMRWWPKMPPRQWNGNEHVYYSAVDVVKILKR
jgi:hypothetical protein